MSGAFPRFRSLPKALRSLQFVQADPIRAPARAQDLVLRQRVPGYVAGDLERKYARLGLEEGYLFAYGFMTPEVWRSLRWRPRAPLSDLEAQVLEAVREIGRTHPRALEPRFGDQTVKNYWGGNSRQTKRILESLHHHGLLRVSHRERGVRVYAVAPDDPETPAPEARYVHLAEVTAKAFGPCTAQFLLTELRPQNHLLPSRRARKAAVDRLVETSALSRVSVDEVEYLWDAAAWRREAVPERVRILAPFDPLVRDRARFERLWGWTYRFEAYTPEQDRVRGYYAMPLLWRDEVLGWANARVEAEVLNVQLGFTEARPRARAFRHAAELEVESLATFLGLPSGHWTLKL